MKFIKGLKTVFIFFWMIYSALCSLALADDGSIPFSPGEKLRYSIYAAGWRVGYQTIELKSIRKYNGIDVYMVKGLSRTTPFVSIFYRLNDDWSIFIERSSLFPLRIEKDWQEGKKEGYYVYEIDQQEHIVTLHNISGGNTKTIEANNTVFDIFSLIYYYRVNHVEFESSYTFDFLETKSVRTVHFQNEGEVEIRVPQISRQKLIAAQKLKQIGGIGIEIYIGTDNLKLPLKMIVPSILPRKKVIDIEFYIDRYYPGKDQKNIPAVYRLIKKK